MMADASKRRIRHDPANIPQTWRFRRQRCRAPARRRLAGLRRLAARDHCLGRNCDYRSNRARDGERVAPGHAASRGSEGDACGRRLRRRVGQARHRDTSKLRTVRGRAFGLARRRAAALATDTRLHPHWLPSARPGATARSFAASCSSVASSASRSSRPTTCTTPSAKAPRRRICSCASRPTARLTTRNACAWTATSSIF